MSSTAPICVDDGVASLSEITITSENSEKYLSVNHLSEPSGCLSFSFLSFFFFNLGKNSIFDHIRWNEGESSNMILK